MLKYKYRFYTGNAADFNASSITLRADSKEEAIEIFKKRYVFSHQRWLEGGSRMIERQNNARYDPVNKCFVTYANWDPIARRWTNKEVK